MRIKVFDLNEGVVVINPNCLLIPELKAIYDQYDDPIPAFCFVHFTCDPFGPYANLSDSQKEEVILDDYPGEYTLEDECMFKAVEKIKTLYETPSMELRRNARVGLKTLGDYLAKASIRDEDKGGNLGTFNTALKSIAKINQEFRTLDRDVEEEFRIRGGGQIGYDEI